VAIQSIRNLIVRADVVNVNGGATDLDTRSALDLIPRTTQPR
jgi:hypothetical protein